MWYTITILILTCCAYASAASLRTPVYSAGRHGTERAVSFPVADASPPCVYLAQAEKADNPPKKEPGPEKKNSAPGDTRQQEEPPQQKDKKPPAADFVPSEKIDADKAVDFPADI